MEKYQTLQEVVDAVRSGKEDETKLSIVQDNDCSHIYVGPCEDEQGNELDNCIYHGKGYYDTDDLWKIVFPKANVEWC